MDSLLFHKVPTFSTNLNSSFDVVKFNMPGNDREYIEAVVPIFWDINRGQLVSKETNDGLIQCSYIFVQTLFFCTGDSLDCIIAWSDTILLDCRV